MSKFFFHAVVCSSAMFFATSSFAINTSKYSDIAGTHECAKCSIIHNVKEESKAFEPSDARSIAESIGYTVLTDPEKQKDRYIMLGKKGGFYSELHVTSDRKIYVERMVDRNDPQWGSKIQR